MKKLHEQAAAVMSITALIIGLCAGCSTETKASQTIYERAQVSTAEQARKLLEEGNTRYVSDNLLDDDISGEKREGLATNGQEPFAVIICCSDSRVPPETVFDQGVGDLFVIHNAGNVIDDISLGSIEYAVEHLETPLVVVLGHENCGAVKAAVDGGEAPGSIGAIMERIQTSLDKVKAQGAKGDELYTQCEDENIQNSVQEIKASTVIAEKLSEEKVTVISAKYDINTGEVHFDK